MSRTDIPGLVEGRYDEFAFNICGEIIMEPWFDHERLEVYRAARHFNREVHGLLKQLPRGSAESRDNLRRAAMSITRNIAEGSGKWKIRDKVNFYHIARASATESAASLDELIDFELARPEKVQVPKQVLARVVALLIGMIRSLEARPASDMRTPPQNRS